eukprot:6469995-Prymnesium_polylepis.1
MGRLRSSMAIVSLLAPSSADDCERGGGQRLVGLSGTLRFDCETAVHVGSTRGGARGDFGGRGLAR